MSNAIENLIEARKINLEVGLRRLLLSKNDFTEGERELGKVAGVKWALETADWSALDHLRRNDNSIAIDTHWRLYHLLADEGYEAEHVNSLLGTKCASDELVKGFVEGVLRIMDKVYDAAGDCA
jgi:hypothetical protein